MSPPSPLLAILREEICSSGPLPFARFMELCLYHPQYGYYNSPPRKLGATGDFYTSAHLAPVFARLLASWLESLWNRLGRPDLFEWVELGPGDGLLAAELLQFVEAQFPEFSRRLRYSAVEQSPYLRSLLQQRLAAQARRARILETLPVAPEGPQLCGCVFANEFFDALPVHILVRRSDGWLERCVALQGDGFGWCEQTPREAFLAEQAELLFDPSRHREGYVVELRPMADYWVRRACLALRRGELLTVDYGYTREEWRAGRFPLGSALAYRRHRAFDNLLDQPGLHDLTAHVDFSQLMETAATCGYTLRLFQSQARFLLDLGEKDQFRSLFADCSSEIERQRRAQLLKTLLLPQGMGESFRVLALEKTH